jgi:hypothetical protein
MTVPGKKENQLMITIESVNREEGDDIDPEELEQITHNLRDDLTELDVVENVDLVAKEDREVGRNSNDLNPKGDVVTLGSLLVTLGASAASSLVPDLSNTLKSWLARHERRKISLEIGGDKLEVTGISDREQEKLIEVWISNHMEKNR